MGSSPYSQHFLLSLFRKRAPDTLSDSGCGGKLCRNLLDDESTGRRGPAEGTGEGCGEAA